MTTRRSDTDLISINHFNDKCRICLKSYSDMIDIFVSGISNQIMEVTNIKICNSDNLPRKLCQDCETQLKEFHKFRCLAKDSDEYLRTLLKANEQSVPTAPKLPSKKVPKKKSKIHGKHMRLKNSKNSKENLMNEKMYLILVSDASNNSGSQNEICIKDLDVENENTEITNICKSLIKNQSGNNGHLNDLPDNNSTSHKTDIDLTKEHNDKDAYEVNLAIYNCSECEESFELNELLIEHLKNFHKTEIFNSSFNYTCPICLKSENDRNLFMNHLSDHKNEGFSFYKVDRLGRHIPLTKLEKEIFQVPKKMDESSVRNKIFKINVNSYTCSFCKKIVSAISLREHLKVCSPDLKDDLSPHLKYTCPACNVSWIDNHEAMSAHLSSHRVDNVYFVKVNDFGEPVDVTEEDTAFTEFEKALEYLKFDNEGDYDVKVMKIQDFYTCIICDFQADSIYSLSEHYSNVHDEVTRTTVMPCPVCLEHFKFIDLDESVKFLEHLKNHKSEGVVFLMVDKNGSIVKNCSDGSGLFSDVRDLFDGKVLCLELEFISHVYVPEVCLDPPPEDQLDNDRELSPERDLTSHLPGGQNRSDREYVCEKCGRKCFGRGNYKRHFATHSEKVKSLPSPKRPSCSVCNKTFSNRTALNEHRKHHENVDSDGSDSDSKRKICEICGRRLSNNASLAKHRRLHVTDRKSQLFKCKICERGFRREPALNRHVSHHLNPNYFECELCKLPLPSSASLERHKLWHADSSVTHDCKVCKLSFLTKDRLIAHQTHTGHHQDRKHFECNVCHERFFVGREFSKHIKLHPKYKMSECSLCGKRLSTVQSLMLHLSRHFESNSILCPHCGKQFFEERNYRRHLLTHNGVKPFSCDIDSCKKSFYTYFELNRHKKYHNNTRDFSCPYCPKSFHEANHLKVHIRTHTGERPYTCPHCNKGFVTRTRCKQHINLIHQGIGCDLIQSNISKKVAVFEALETVA